MTAAATIADVATLWERLMRLQVDLAFASELPFYRNCEDWLRASRVADLGCGVGEHLAQLAHDFPDKQFTGIEQDSRHVARAVERFRSADRVSIVRDDVFSCTGQFDALVARLLVQHLEAPERLFTVAEHLLAPQGTLIVVESVDAERKFAPVVPEVEDIFAGFRAARRGAGCDRDAGFRLLERAEDAGFTVHRHCTVIASATSAERRRLFVETYTTVFAILEADFGLQCDFDAALRGIHRWAESPGAFAQIGVHLACYRRSR